MKFNAPEDFIPHNIMEIDVQIYASELSEASCLEDIEKVVAAFAKDAGFEYYFYRMIYPESFTRETIINVNGFPSGWDSPFFRENSPSLDPVCLHARSHTTPILWNDIYQRADLSAKQHSQIEEMKSSGLRSGLSYSVHLSNYSMGIFSLGNRSAALAETGKLRNILPFGQVFSCNVLDALWRLVNQRNENTNYGKKILTEREQQCLSWAADGKTSYETSKLLSISESTVIFHLQNAAKKLKASNRVHAVAIAVSSGMLIKH